MVKLQITVNEGVEAPSYAHEGDAGLDLRVSEDVVLEPGETKKVGTGISMAIPKGNVGKVFMRSGFATRANIMLANGTGIIDSGYRGEIMLPLFNASDSTKSIPRGERVAQIIIEPYVACELEIVDELDDTERGTGGFGSSGR